MNDELAGLPLFSGASRAEVAAVRRLVTQLPVPAGRVLVREGDRGEQFMIIAEGQATVRRGGQTIAVLGRGDLVGEMSLLEGGRSGHRNATVTAVTDVVVYAGSWVEFRQILRVAPSVADKVRRMVASRTLTNAA